MEASLFLAMCNRANVSCAVACVAILNRLDGDQVKASPDLKKFENAPLEMIIQVNNSALMCKPPITIIFR